MDTALKNQSGIEGSVIIEGRRKLSVSGVEDVDSFDERDMLIRTNLGDLMIKGDALRINKFSVETGELVIEGDIDEAVYQDGAAYNKKGFLARVFS